MSDYEDEDSESCEEHNDDLHDDLYDGKKNVAILVIDICPSMFNDSKSIKKCLAAIYQQYDRMLLQGHLRNISVCLLRNEDIILTALKDNLIESTKKILDLLKTSINDLKQKFERKSPASLRFTLTECMKQFTNLEKINPFIIILTNDDDPHKGDKNENLSAIDVALSLREINVKLVVLPLKENFDYNLFYGELVKAANNVPLLDVFDFDADKSYITVADLVDILDCVIKDKVNIRRYIFRLFNQKQIEISFWVQIRYLVKSNNLYANCTISRLTRNQVESEYVQQSEIDASQWFFHKLGSADISFNKKECCDYKMPHGFRLLHVSDRNEIFGHYKHKRGFILQKDEMAVDENKQKVFDFMWNFCRKKNRFLICGFFVQGNRQSPKKVQLTPDIFQGKPCFIGEFLLNSDEAVYPEENFTVEEKSDAKSTPEMDVISEMMDKMLVKNFSPFQFTSFAYEAKAALIKSQLLDIEQPEVEDTIPTEEDVVNKLEGIYDNLCGIFGTVAEPATKKRREK